MKMAMLAAAAAALMLAAPIHAEKKATLSPEKEQAFKALDLDGDGKVALAEAAGNAGVVMGFDRADRNHDGALDRAEFGRLGQKTKRGRQQASR
jgi:hypothetical protein